MKPASDIDPALIEAYRLSRYQVADGRHQFALEVDHRSAELHRVYAELGVGSASFITAWNPFSKPASRAENQRANQALRAELEQAGFTCLHGFGKARDSQWAEPGLLVLDIARDPACDVGRHYGQNAILWAGADAIPQLILLR